MSRSTKIIATLGPATDDPEMLRRIIIAGVDLVRVNFSHGQAQEHQRRIQAVIDCAREQKRVVGILADLQGPKIRISRFADGRIVLTTGQQFTLDASLDVDAGDVTQVGIEYKSLIKDVSPQDTLLLDDGRIRMVVDQVKGKRIICTVEVGGELSNNKGINRLGGGLSAKALTDKDKKDIKFIATLPVDYIALSFPRSADDVNEARKLLDKAGSKAGIIAKIERFEAIPALDEIINASNGVMVARGDLGVEIGDADVPAVQKQIIHRARALNKPVITATQMMESMIHSTIPTRAEVSDVANAVLDTTDAVMLSAETAVGDHPDIVIEAVSRVCVSAEKHPRMHTSKHRVECHFETIDEAIAMSTMYMANHVDIKAIIAVTESGTTPLLMSRIRTGIPVYGLSRHALTCGKMTLFRGVYPVNFDITKIERTQVNHMAVAELERRDLVRDGDYVIITRGDFAGIHGGTNTLKVIKVGAIN